MDQPHGSAEARDALWSHPDLLPTSEDLDEPLDFVGRQGRGRLRSGAPADAAGPDAAGTEAHDDGRDEFDRLTADLRIDDSAEDGAPDDSPEDGRPGS